MNKKILVLFFVIILLIIPALPKIIKENSSKAQCIYPKPKYIEKNIYCKGKVISKNQAEIYTDTPVLPKKINCSIGEKVKKGDILAEIDSEKTVNILSAESPIEKSMGNIYDLISGISNKELLYAVGKAYNIDKSQVDQLINSAHYRKSESKISYVPSEITAPFDGTITGINLTENILGMNNKPAITIASCDEMVIEAEIPQENANKIYQNMKAEIKNGDYTIYGTVELIYPAAEKNSSQTPTVKIIIKPFTNDSLKSGYNVEVTLKEKESKESLTVPIEAINQDENNNEFVYVFKNNEMLKKNIETGMETPSYTQVKSGLSEDDMVLIFKTPPKENRKIILQGEFNEKSK